jgi:hypothetical protein
MQGKIMKTNINESESQAKRTAEPGSTDKGPGTNGAKDYVVSPIKQRIEPKAKAKDNAPFWGEI